MLPAVILAAIQVLALAGTHSHNDYLRPRPLQDALENGFSSVEVDVYLVDGKLLVGHDRKDLKPDRTIESLYLSPLDVRVRANAGWVYPEKTRLWVLVDIKADGEATYTALKNALLAFPSLKEGIRFVISGDRPVEAIVRDKGLFAALDGRWADLDKGYSYELMPWVSEAWTDHIKWLGTGKMPPLMKQNLDAMVKQVHAKKRLLRFWGAPDSREIWEAQRNTGVDWLNTDHPAELRKWLLAQ